MCTRESKCTSNKIKGEKIKVIEAYYMWDHGLLTIWMFLASLFPQRKKLGLKNITVKW
jgi:hypothetical protein